MTNQQKTHISLIMIWTRDLCGMAWKSLPFQKLSYQAKLSFLYSLYVFQFHKHMIKTMLLTSCIQHQPSPVLSNNIVKATYPCASPWKNLADIVKAILPLDKQKIYSPQCKESSFVLWIKRILAAKSDWVLPVIMLSKFFVSISFKQRSLHDRQWPSTIWYGDRQIL